MANILVVGTQWGDEGKGKIVDCLTQNADVVVRYQGGHNAGHTVVIDNKEFILHLIPSGILHRDKLCLMGNGLVIEPFALIDEIEHLKAKAVVIEDNLKISKTAHLIMPYHILFDKGKELKKGNNKIGTTGRGIGPAYADKYARVGFRIVDLFWPETFKEKLKVNIEEANFLLKNLYNTDPLNFEDIYDELMPCADKLRTFIADTDITLDKCIKEGKNILFEGAQGTLLDIDHGTYPFVTSSSACAGGAMTGLGIGPKCIDEIYGIVKAYTTRVGSGPFPCELNDDTGNLLREMGGEYGSTTGRPRRCGWLDMVILKHSVRINGITGIVLTKLDVLDSFNKIEVCMGYEYKGEMITDFPKELEILNNCTAVYKQYDGWKESTKGITNFDELPKNAKAYIKMIEDTLDTPVIIISTGKKRSDIIYLTQQ
ncbi:adenylosuccinate synthetase [Candidatus Magnetoovum chiemensis]|nr:adenylosuccinate synthetase [Candidatus Magnetoovum chiemensis]